MNMRHHGLVRAAILTACLAVPTAAAASKTVLLAPQVQAQGVDILVARAFESLLAPELERRLDCRLIRTEVSAGSRPCADAVCAARAARRAGAAGAFVATLTRRNDRLVATLQ